MPTYNIFDLLKSVPDFDGKEEDLTLFIEYIVDVRQHAEASYLRLFDLRIRHKIVGKANISLINNNNPTDWNNIKAVLKSNFCITESIESIVNKIKTSEMRTTIEEFYEYLKTLLTRLNLRAAIEENNQWYTCTNNEKMVLRIFISKLPNEAKLIQNARNPNILMKAKEILVETEYFYRYFNLSKNNTTTFYSNKYEYKNFNSNNSFGHNWNQFPQYGNLTQNRNYLARHLKSTNLGKIQNYFSNNNDFFGDANKYRNDINSQQKINCSPRYASNNNSNDNGRKFQEHFSQYKDCNSNYSHTNILPQGFSHNEYNSDQRQLSRNSNQINIEKDIQDSMNIGTLEQPNFYMTAEDLYPI